MAERLHTLERFVAVHRQREAKLKSYLLTAWGLRQRNETVIRCLEKGSAKSLFATNNFVRIEYARAAVEAFQTLMDDEHIEEEVLFVTLAPRRFALPLSRSPGFEHEELKAWSKEVLHGLDYVGVVEAAFYGSALVTPQPWGKTISWHSHAIVWGVSESELEGRFAVVNRKELPLLSGAVTAHIRELTRGRIVGRVLYMLKAPLSEYRVYRPKRDYFDFDANSTVREYQQKKGPLGPGDAIKMCEVLGKRTMPMLTFAGGDGVPLLGKVEARARGRLVRAHEKREARLRRIAEKHAL